MNETVFRKICQSISNILHPLMMLTYAAIILVYFTPMQILPVMGKWYLVFMVCFDTCIIPVLCITALFKLKFITDWTLRNRKDRAIPLFLNVITYAVCAWTLTGHSFIMDWALAFYYGAIGLAFIAWVVSYWWKISAHAMGIAGLTTAILLLYISFPNYMPISLVFISIILTGLICSIRVYLGRHTMAQVTAGTLAGMAVMLTAYTIFA